METKIKIPMPFNLSVSANCGQCFRFTENPDGTVEGFSGDRYIKLKQQNDTLILYDMEEWEFDTYWRRYFDLFTDYNEINEKLSASPLLVPIVESQKGIRVFNADFFETLISFIISQNNNIPRIKKIIECLCENFGTKTPFGYAFPTALELKGVTAEDLSIIKAGFRARYIADAVEKVNDGTVSCFRVKTLPLESARNELMQIVGVGKKVADCTLLFSCGRRTAFPEDVWIKRAVADLFPMGLPKEAKGNEGLLQQYIFNYYRLANTK